ncbi:DUF5615 family PIN-like protein [Microlunatus endophyticus]|uniref:DUF5615 family PIN-like protein n=1 Tax=Microlunatus endophyticus TaxID=1716077 RepID=UPI00227A5359|nr:DUF5615 family PIN-like protein [Microlunatus endophyticus]
MLDEHYPGRLARELTSDGIDVVALISDRPELRGADVTTVLSAAATEGRVVVTEDVSTFGVAAAQVPDHVGIVYCHHSRFPRTPSGLNRLRLAIKELADNPPDGLGRLPVVWWLQLR